MTPSNEVMKIETWDAARPPLHLLEVNSLDDPAQVKILQNLERFGICQLRISGQSPEEHLLLSLEKAIGPACTRQNGYRGKIKRIEPKPSGQKNSGDTTADLGLHVDGTQHKKQPAVLLFQYITGAKSGAESVFIDIARALEDIKREQRESLLSRLARPDAATFSKNKMTLVAPVFHKEGHLSVSCRLRFDGVMRPHPDLIADYRFLEEHIGAEKYRWVFTPRDGDIIIFDNWRLMHARDEVFGQRIRQHNRMWISRLAPHREANFNLGIRPLSTGILHAIEVANAETRK